MTLMPWWQLVLAIAVAATLHAVALRIAAALMVEVRVAYRLALKIVVIEYAAMLAIAGMLTAIRTGSIAITIASCSIAYLFIGGICLGYWLNFRDGARLGLGNGILIQAIQIPLIIPVLIAGSFFV